VTAANWKVQPPSSGITPVFYSGPATIVADGSILQLPPGATLSDFDREKHGRSTGEIAVSSSGLVHRIGTDIDLEPDENFVGGRLQGIDMYTLRITDVPVLAHTTGTDIEITYTAPVSFLSLLVTLKKEVLSTVELFRPGSADSVSFDFIAGGWDAEARTLRVQKRSYVDPISLVRLSFGLNEYAAHDFAIGSETNIEVQGFGAIATTGETILQPGAAVVVYRSTGAGLPTLAHELVHALGHPHRCGNWDYRSARGSAGARACLMHYDTIDFMLTEPVAGQRRLPEPWLFGPRDTLLCEEHIFAIRNRNLESQ
jgi:hypothetical protein